MGTTLIQRSFAAGELAPALHARADVAKYAIGLKCCRNFLVRREGGVSNRAGTRYVATAKNQTAGARIFEYIGDTQSYLIEMGQASFRFYKNGGKLLVSGMPAYDAGTAYVPGDLVSSAAVVYYCHSATTGHAPPDVSYWYAQTSFTVAGVLYGVYEIPSPYALDSLPDWKQNGNVITLTHDEEQPRELVCSSETRWVLQTVSTVPSIGVPSGLGGTGGAVGTRTYKYVVTAAKAETYEESNPSIAHAIASCAEPTVDSPNVLTWGAVTGAAEYYVYGDGGFGNDTYGYLGCATGTTSFKDVGFTPDFNDTPPVARVLFTTSGNYPRRCAMYQQRRVFANTINEPDAIFMSRPGFTSNFGVRSPLQDDDAVTVRLAGNNLHAVDHLVALKSGLVVGTGGGEWTVTGGGGRGTPITPSSVSADQETYAGVSKDVRPVVAGNTVIYLQARGTIVRELRFDQQVEGLAGRDLSIYATHLFERKTIVAMAYQQVPHSIIWFVRSDGFLLGLTYIPEQEIWGWHWHDTDGTFEDCAVVPEADEEVLYLLVARTIGGVVKRYIERLARREIRDEHPDHDSYFVDCGVSYSLTYPQHIFTGLDHLEGEVVAILADGIVIYNGDPADTTKAALYTVTAGKITIPVASAAKNVHIGLPIRFAEIETLDLDANGLSVRDKQKRIGNVAVLIEKSSRGFYAGPDTANLVRYEPQDWEPLGDLHTGQYQLTIPTTWDKYGRVFIRQADPLPLTILGVLPNADLGG